MRNILSDCDRKQWKWLPSSENIADEATRNITVCLNKTLRWHQDPAFLYEQEELWPKNNNQPTNDEQIVVVLLTSAEISTRPYSRWKYFHSIQS